MPRPQGLEDKEKNPSRDLPGPAGAVASPRQGTACSLSVPSDGSLVFLPQLGVPTSPPGIRHICGFSVICACVIKVWFSSRPALRAEATGFPWRRSLQGPAEPLPRSWGPLRVRVESRHTEREIQMHFRLGLLWTVLEGHDVMRWISAKAVTEPRLPPTPRASRHLLRSNSCEVVLVWFSVQNNTTHSPTPPPQEKEKKKQQLVVLVPSKNKGSRGMYLSGGFMNLKVTNS